MPQFAESVVSATIGKWLKQPGDRVEEYEPICEVITDKVTAELPSTASGVLLDILVPEGETVEVGTVVCRIGEPVAEAGTEGAPAEAAAPVNRVEAGTAAPVPAGEPDMRRRYSPAVRKLAEEHGLDLSLVPGTGLGGRVTRKDVLRFLEDGGQAAGTQGGAGAYGVAGARGIGGERGTGTEPIAGAQGASGAQSTAGIRAAGGTSAAYGTPAGGAASTPATGRPAAASAQNVPARPTASLEVREYPPMPDIVVEPPKEGGREYFIDVTPIRKTIANRMRQSVQEIPHAWTSIEVDVTNLTKLRNKVKDEFRRNEGVNLTYMAFLIKAVVSAIKDYPIMNSVWSDDKIIVKRDINISLAVGTEDSVLTPVIRNADQKNIIGIAREVEDLARRTRSGQLRPQDMQGGTFTINNTGTFGSILSYPIINYPQAAILTLEAIVKKPVVIDDMIAVRSMVNLCLSFDHRILDGVICGKFHQRVKQNLEAFGPDTNLY